MTYDDSYLGNPMRRTVLSKTGGPRTLQNEWGLSLHLQSSRGSEQRQVLIIAIAQQVLGDKLLRSSTGTRFSFSAA